LILATVFTISHSITLSIAALGIIQIPPSVVEPLIALSIIWIAVENCLNKQSIKWRTFIVFIFGLLHGLGFASVLSHYGLPKDSFLSLLFAFNIGVELGQFTILITAFILIKLILKQNWQQKNIRTTASILIGLVGVFWFIERVFIN